MVQPMISGETHIFRLIENLVFHVDGKILGYLFVVMIEHSRFPLVYIPKNKY